MKPIIIAVLLIIIAAALGVGYYIFTQNNPGASEAVNKNLLRAYEIGYKYGNEKSQVVLMEFGDFQCPACASYEPLVKKIKEEYKDKILFVFVNFPLRMHPNADEASRAAVAAGEYGKFFEMADLLFSNQEDWSSLRDPYSKFEQYAVSLGIPKNDFSQIYNSDEVKNIVKESVKVGNALRVRWTPSFFVNGELLKKNPTSYNDFKLLIDNALQNAPFSQDESEEELYHAHADFKVVILGKEIDFSKPEYQSTEEKELHPYAHLHDGNGKVIHFHKKGLKLSDFFSSLGYKLGNFCIKVPNTESNIASLRENGRFCSTDDYELSLFVNGEKKDLVGDYEPQDLDRILIIYDSKSNIQNLNFDDYKITDDACIYSEKCPERGSPPEESCVGGLGTKCE